jgi:cell wall-associated NlpC family hydrolase
MKFRVATLAFLLGATLASPVSAAPSLQDVRDKVRALQEEAAAAGESAQQAQVELNSLTRTLASVQRQAEADAKTVGQFQKSLGAIAREEYKSGGFGKGMELLFSSDPKLYLSAAGSLESITKKQALQLRKYAVAKQRLNAKTATVNDKLALVKKAQEKYAAQKRAAEGKLAAAEALLASLTKAERERLAKLIDNQENADQAASLAEVAKLNLGSGRGAIALRFAIKQIGDRYVFGAAGPTLWDCSGLTMRAFQQAGVSLPHSAAAQSRFGRSVKYNQLKPGDLVFFGRGNYISHVGIYLSSGRMVDAPRPGSRVKVQDFGSRFGSLAFYGARRI